MTVYCIKDSTGLSDEDVIRLRSTIKPHFTSKVNLEERDSVLSKAVLCHLLDVRYGLTDYVIDCDDKGKPYIIGEKCFFNISHSDGKVLCAVSDGKVGCDIERLRPCNDAVVRRHFTPQEAELLSECESRDLYFTRLWTLKESILKHLGCGLSGGLSSYDFSEYIHKQSFTAYGLHFKCALSGEYAFSLCGEGSDIKEI